MHRDRPLGFAALEVDVLALPRGLTSSHVALFKAIAHVSTPVSKLCPILTENHNVVHPRTFRQLEYRFLGECSHLPSQSLLSTTLSKLFVVHHQCLNLCSSSFGVINHCTAMTRTQSVVHWCVGSKMTPRKFIARREFLSFSWE